MSVHSRSKCKSSLCTVVERCEMLQWCLHWSKILGIAETKDSTGRVEAEKVKEILDNWNVTEKIIALGFDTTSSNTGIRKGSCTILQQLLERQLLWLACRHHIPERIIAVSFITLFGETKGPDVPLFKTLKNCWDNLDLSNIKLPDIPSCYDGDVDSLLSYINDKLEPENLKLLPRCDYKEYLELALGKRVTHTRYSALELITTHGGWAKPFTFSSYPSFNIR